MPKGAAPLSVLFFFIRFVLIIPVCLMLWWLVLPAVAWLWGQGVGVMVLIFTSLPIDAVKVTPEGILNTSTTLSYTMGDVDSTINIARFSMNVPSFIALVLATRRLTLARRFAALGIGGAILFMMDGLFIFLTLAFKEWISSAPDIPVAFGQFLVTLPFILWITLAYWGQTSGIWAGLGKNGARAGKEEGG